VDHEPGAAVAERRFVVGDAADLPAVLEQERERVRVDLAGVVLDEGLDGAVGQLRQVLSPPVVPQPGRRHGVEHRLQAAVRDRPEEVDRRPEVLERLEIALAFRDVAAPAADDADGRLPLEPFGDELLGRRSQQGRCRADFVRGVLADEVAPGADHFGRALDGECHQPRVHDRTDRVDPELERRDHAEVAAAAAERPRRAPRSRSRSPSAAGRPP